MNNVNISIIEGIKQGDEKSLQILFNKYNGILVAFAKNIVRNPPLAEDFVQDAFCALWENRKKLNTDQPIHSYLFKIVYRRCVDYLRKCVIHEKFKAYAESKLKELDLMQISFENTIISTITSEEAHKIIQRTLQNLPDQTREIFVLSREKALKNTEIAEKLGLSVKTIEYHISKALQQLRNSLKEFL